MIKKPTEIIDAKGKVEKDPQKIANILNDYFLEKITNIIDPAERVKKMMRDKVQNLETFALRPVNKSGFRRIVKKMKNGKVCGLDTTDGFPLKNAVRLIEDSLIHLFKSSI